MRSRRRRCSKCSGVYKDQVVRSSAQGGVAQTSRYTEGAEGFEAALAGVSHYGMVTVTGEGVLPPAGQEGRTAWTVRGFWRSGDWGLHHGLRAVSAAAIPDSVIPQPVEINRKLGLGFPDRSGGGHS